LPVGKQGGCRIKSGMTNVRRIRRGAIQPEPNRIAVPAVSWKVHNVPMFALTTGDGMSNLPAQPRRADARRACTRRQRPVA